MTLRLGKKDARPGSITFKFGTYVPDLPVPPKVFGRPWLITDWGLYANDVASDCVWAGAAHETMLWTAEVGSKTIFTDAAVLSDYTASTGYDPKVPATDEGTDLQAAASYRQKTGIVDAAGVRHTIEAYAALSIDGIDQIAKAAYLLGAVGIGAQMPSSAMDQFDRAEPWSVAQGASMIGGHYFPLVGRNSAGNFLIATWGRLQAVTAGWLYTYMDEAVAYLSLERLRNKLSPQGFDEAALTRDLLALKAAT